MHNAESVLGPHQISNRELGQLALPFLRLRKRLCELKQIDDANPDQGREDRVLAALLEIFRFLREDSWIRQYGAELLVEWGAFAWERIHQKARRRCNVELPSTHRLQAVVAFLVAVLTDGGRRSDAFTPKEAAEIIIKQFEGAGLRLSVPRTKTTFITAKLAVKWYYPAKGGYANEHVCKYFHALHSTFAGRHPEHKQWDQEQRLKWLAKHVNQLKRKALSGAFSSG
jgi:hypothetical protein